jgi:hypothetical protein
LALLISIVGQVRSEQTHSTYSGPNQDVRRVCLQLTVTQPARRDQGSLVNYFERVDEPEAATDPRGIFRGATGLEELRG